MNIRWWRSRRWSSCGTRPTRARGRMRACCRKSSSGACWCSRCCFMMWARAFPTKATWTPHCASRRAPWSAYRSPERSAFLEGFPTRYLHTHTAAEIERHMQLELDSRAVGAAVEIEKTGSAYRLTLVTGDRPFLFASVAGTLSSFGMNILKAEAFANRRGTVLDTFSFADPMRTLELNPTEMERLKSTVEQVELGRA